MTGYTVHTGSNENFSSGWDQIFAAGKKPAKKGSDADVGKKSVSAKGVKGATGAKSASGGKKASKKAKRGK